MNKSIILTSSFLLLTSSLLASVPFKIGVAGYSFHKMGLDKGLAVMQKIDCHYLCHKDFFVSYDASDADIAAFKAKLAAAGVECTATGPLYAKDEETVRRQFEFAKKLGVKVLVGVPFEVREGQKGRYESDRMLDIIEKLVKEYDMVYVIHNHGPDMPDLFPTAEAVWERIKNRDHRIGFCLDVGHQRRAGVDPTAAIRKYAERIYDVHIKNILLKKNAKGFAGNFAVPGPRGDLNIPEIFKALADVGYAGVCHIEYEEGFEDNSMQLAESVGYYRGVMATIVAKAVMKPVPKNANTLTDAEKAEGFELLFDGAKLPTDKWVGQNDDFKCFPKKGWYVKDGCLSMRPIKGISEAREWFPLPPEDVKLGNGGDIVTIKKYRDFVFKFDYRLTRAANSGVKYFYDETKNNRTCEEYQILENVHPDSDKGVDGNRKSASLYDIFPAHADGVQKPAGEWNSGMIVSKGNHVEHWLNGKKVLEFERGSKDFRDGVKASKYADKGTDGQPWGEIAEGRILLQDHTDSTVSFCNLKVKAL